MNMFSGLFFIILLGVLNTDAVVVPTFLESINMLQYSVMYNVS